MQPVSYVSKYYLSEDIPEVFKKAQALVDAKWPEPETIREPIPIPVKTIDSNPNIQGPLRVTKKWYVKEKEKANARRNKSKAEAEMQVIQLIAQRDMLRGKLSKLDPLNKKDSKKIAAANCRLKLIEDHLQCIKDQYGFNINELDHGTRIGRFLARWKRKAKKVVKKIKKFINRHSDTFMAIGSVFTSIAAVFVTKLII